MFQMIFELWEGRAAKTFLFSLWNLYFPLKNIWCCELWKESGCYKKKKKGFSLWKAIHRLKKNCLLPCLWKKGHPDLVIFFLFWLFLASFFGFFFGLTPLLRRKWPRNHQVGGILLFWLSKNFFCKIRPLFQVTGPENRPSRIHRNRWV